MNIPSVPLTPGLFTAGLWLPPRAAAQDVSPQSSQELLAQLKGLHLPADPAWWPIAPGWWAVAVLICTALFFLYRSIRKRHTKRPPSWLKGALFEHRLLEKSLTDGTSLNNILAQSSVLMRKVALAQLPRELSAAAKNEQWLQLLDEIGGTDQYTNGPGKLLLTHPYQPYSDLDREQVAGLLELMHRTILNSREIAGDV